MAVTNRSMQSAGRYARDTASGTLHSVRHYAGDAYDHSRDAVGHLTESLEDSLREQPVRWVLLGIGLGCLISAMLIDR